MSFKPDPVRKAREQVEAQLREAILSSQFASGERLPSEVELAESFGVSRATIREALGSLASSGIVTKSPGARGGTFVRVVDHESLGISLGESIENTLKFGNISFEEIYHVRRLLEVPAASGAALHRTEADIEWKYVGSVDTFRLGAGAPRKESTCQEERIRRTRQNSGPKPSNLPAPRRSASPRSHPTSASLPRPSRTG